MIKQYHITGMTCNGCLHSVRSKLLDLEEVQEAIIDLPTGQAILHQKCPIPIQTLSTILGSKYSIATDLPVLEVEANNNFSWATYKPLFLIVLYILGTCLVVQYPFDNFSGSLLMRHFMAGFFLVFSFFKLLHLKGFADSYAMYDLVTARWRSWGYIYPFLELILGFLYLTNSFPLYTNWITIVVLGVGSLGVIKSNWNKEEIQCACLGDVFNLPMSTITIVENVAMITMAVLMIL